MSFNAGGGGIANANDVALSNPSNGQVLAYNTSVGKWQNQTNSGGSGGITYEAAYAVVIKSGGNYAAYRQSTGLIIGSVNADAGIVINAALASASSNGGGMIQIASGATAVATPIVIPAQCGLRGGGYNYDRHAGTLGGHYLYSNGLSSSQAVITSGAAGSGGVAEGVEIVDLGINGSGTAHGISTFNCTDLYIHRCAIINVNRGIWIQSDQSPDAGGVGARLNSLMVRSADDECLRVEGVGASDGSISDCRLLSSPNNVYLGGGGWLVTGTHITGNSGTSVNVSVVGSNCVLTGNYFDSANATGGYNIINTSAKTVITGNYFINSGANAAGCMSTGATKGVISNNTYTTSSGTPFLQYTGSASAATSGSLNATIVGNIGNPGPVFVDNGGNVIGSSSGSGWYFAGNINY